MQSVKRSGLVLIIALVLAAAGRLLLPGYGEPLPVHADGNTFYVSPTGLDVSACGGEFTPCRTIPYAVSLAGPDDVIRAAGGVYTEPFTVTVPGLKIYGAGAFAATLNGENARGPLVTFAAGLTQTTVFSGFTVKNGFPGGGLYVADNSAPTIRGVQVYSNTGNGISLAGGAAPVLRGNTLCGNTAFDLQADGSAGLDLSGNWWGLNEPAAGTAYTGTITVTPAISVGLEVSQNGIDDDLQVGVPALVTITMRGGGAEPPPGTAVTLWTTGGILSPTIGSGLLPGNNTVELTLVGGVATAVFTPTAAHSAVFKVYHFCYPQTVLAQQSFISHQISLPVVMKALPEPQCPTTSSAHFNLIPVAGAIDHPDYLHGDLNLSLRGYDPVSGVTLGLVDYTGATDSGSPRLKGLFADGRVPAFSAAYQAHDWNWACGAHGCPGGLLSTWPTTVIGMVTTPGEAIRIPSRNATIYDTGGHYRALVLYAEERRITLAYTRDDHAGKGYTVHLEGVCVDPNLLALYKSRVKSDGYRVSNGGYQLPALENGQTLGTALASEIRVAIRDRGNFMDPRSRKDWWQ